VVIEEEIRDRLSFKWFLGIDADAPPPDATTLVRFRERLGHEKFAEIFNTIVKTARQKNLINDKLYIIDATAVKAKVDTWRINKEHKKDKNNDQPATYKKDYIERKSQDKDARIGDTSTNKKVFVYKRYIQMDQDSEIIVSTTAQPANK
jgi:IS5 family transposase